MADGRQARAARLLRRTRLGAVMRRLPLWRGVLVLCYHRIGDVERSPLNPHLFSATQEEFDAQMRFLATSCDVIALDELADALDRGRRAVLVTFDDGYRDNHDLALPVLREHGIPAAFFLATDFLDAPYLPWWEELALLAARDLALLAEYTDRYKTATAEAAEGVIRSLAERVGLERPGRQHALAEDLWMTWDMARALRDAGQAIGGHTMGHPILARLPEAEQAREVVGGLDRIEAEIGARPEWFSYPVGGPGDFDGRSQSVVRDAGMTGAFAFNGGVATAAADRFALRRAAVQTFMDVTKLEAATALPGVFARW